MRAFVGFALDASLMQQGMLLPELCLAHSDWTFVVYHPLAKVLFGHRIPNLLCLDMFTHEDLLILATFISQMDAFVFQGTPGVAVLPFLIALSIGCPTVFCGNSDGFEEIFPKPHITAEPTVESLSSTVELCLSRGRVAPSIPPFTWEQMALQLLDAFRNCHNRHTQNPICRFKGSTRSLFHYHYVKSSGAVEVTASLLPGSAKVSIEDALKLVLQGEFSENEIRVVINRLRSQRRFSTQ